MKTTAFGHISFSLGILIGSCMGCSQDAVPINGSGGAGQGGATSAGGTTSSGGATGIGGASSAGGVTTGAGGASGAGGATSAGGVTTGVGGTNKGSSASGGASAVGGATALGGVTSTGGVAANQGGGTGAGGATGIGGAGGTKNSGAGTGGTTHVVGSTGSSGAIGTGGTISAGGSTSACPVFKVPEVSSLTSIPELPDPFKFVDGTRMTSKDEWTCRREELSALIQAFEYGSYPPKPDSVTSTLSGTTLTVQVAYGGKSITLSPTVTLPSGTGPFPVYIGLSGGGYPPPFAASQITSMGIAHIAYITDDIASDFPGKGGSFYTLYGTSVTAGVLMAWAWGAHRIVDALEQNSTFNATKVIVNGFSRWGKGALVAGAFDERIALTIASASGAGGIGSWRSADVQNNAIHLQDAQASGVQTLVEVTDEAPHWFATAFKSFRNKTQTLPFDGHSVAALVAPRPLLVTESNDDAWNNPIGCYTSGVAAHKVWEFLGIADSMGFAAHNNGGHGFGEFTESLAFINKFILGKTANTTVMENPGNYAVSATDIPWSVP